MDCALFEDVVHDIERPGTAGFAWREKALAHAESCAECARRMTELESLDAGLRALSGAMAARKAPASVEVALLAEFHKQKMAHARWSVQRQIAALATAAAVLLAVGFSLHHFIARGANPTSLVAHEPTAQPSPLAPSTSPAGGAQNSGNLIDADGSEYASFVALPYADDPSALDEGTVVRVEMPRAALASFGLPVAAMEADGTVRADLIVSADGTPQAIRLVSPGSASQQ
jgi:hypothetical protein